MSKKAKKAAIVLDLANDAAEEVIEDWLDVLSSFDKAITSTLGLKKEE